MTGAREAKVRRGGNSVVRIISRAVYLRCWAGNWRVGKRRARAAAPRDKLCEQAVPPCHHSLEFITLPLILAFLALSACVLFSSFVVCRPLLDERSINCYFLPHPVPLSSLHPLSPKPCRILHSHVLHRLHSNISNPWSSQPLLQSTQPHSTSTVSTATLYTLCLHSPVLQSTYQRSISRISAV